MKLRNKLTLAAAGLLLSAGFTVASGSASAATGSCMHWSNSQGGLWLNAWNGGPYVKAWHACDPAHGSFTLIFPGGGNVQLKFTGDSAWAGRCIGNANNDPDNESSSLDTCSPAGWGTLFTPRTTGFCSAGKMAFQNNHSGGYLGPPDPAGDGSPWYLNKPGFFCFDITG